MGIKFKQKGDFSRVTNFMINSTKKIKMETLEKYGRLGVLALAAATPIDTGETASSWYYEIDQTGKNRTSLIFCNSNVNEGVNIAVIIQYGHGTGSGAWVEGVDYINPALEPVFDKISKDIWREVTSS